MIVGAGLKGAYTTGGAVIFFEGEDRHYTIDATKPDKKIEISTREATSSSRQPVHIAR
jgi:hypothetical protein